jgi:cytochrome c556
VRELVSSSSPASQSAPRRPTRATRLIALAAGLASLGALALPALVRADNQDVIDYREHIMKTMAAQADAIELIVQHKLPADDDSNIPAHAKALALAASTAKAAFAMNVPGGQAKPNVWTDSADFNKRMDELAANTDALAKAADSGGVEAVASRIQSALTCKSCHDQYREQKKK